MSARRECTEGGAAVMRSNPIERVEALDRAEREALKREDWDALDRVLQDQKELWRELTARVRGESASDDIDHVLAALEALYRTRRRNHALLEQAFADMRRRLMTAHTGVSAREVYRRAARRAA